MQIQNARKVSLPKVIAFAAVTAIGCLFLPQSSLSRAGAAVINPGNTAPTTGTATFSGTIIDDETHAFNSGTFAGSLHSQVYQESSGSLDFVYQFSNSNIPGADGIKQFAGAGYNYLFANADDQTVAGDVSPFQVDRNPATSNGLNDTINFFFPAAAPVLPGQSSDLLVVKTTATNFYEGTASLIDSLTANAQAPMPVPEPATLGLLSVGLVGLLARPGRKSAK
jgi:hypothetical protein